MFPITKAAQRIKPLWTYMPRYAHWGGETLLEGFESAADWTVIAGNAPIDDAVDYMDGTQSINLTTNAGASSTMQRTVSWNLNAVADQMRLWVKLTSPTSGTIQFKLFLSANVGFTKYFDVLLTWTMPTAGQGYPEWQVFTIKRSDWTATGGMTWADTVVRFRVQAVADAGATDWNFDGFYGGFVPKSFGALTFDDGLASVYSLALPIMRNRNVRGTMYVISGLIGTGNYMTSAQLKDLEANGWDIGNHSDTHPHFITQTQAQIEAEIQACEDDLTAWGITNGIKHLAYPYGELDNTDVVAAMAAKSMLTGRGITSQSFAYPVADWYQVKCVQIQNTTTLAAVKTQIDTLIATGQSRIWYLHAIVDSETPAANEWSTGRLMGMIEYCYQRGLPLLKISEIYDLQSKGLLVPIAR